MRGKTRWRRRKVRREKERWKKVRERRELRDRRREERKMVRLKVNEKEFLHHFSLDSLVFL